MGGKTKFNIKSRIPQKPREPRYISFEDDLIRDIMSLVPQYNENQIKHVLLSNIRTIKNKIKNPECFVIATPIGEFYLKTVYMEKVKESIINRVLEKRETRKMRDKVRRFVEKVQIYKEKRSYWAETYGIWYSGRGKKLYLHDYPSAMGMYPFSKQEKEELQNMLY